MEKSFYDATHDATQISLHTQINMLLLDMHYGILMKIDLQFEL